MAQYRVAIIGGGAVGCSCLYHLAKAGWSDCVLVERDELTSGSTWHAAGNIPTYSSNINIMKYQYYSTQLYTSLSDEVDYPMNYHKTGSIRIAQNEERMDEFHYVTDMANMLGYGYEMHDPDGLKAYYPFMETNGILGGIYDPNDGDIDPSQLTQAFAKGARDLGAKIHRNWRVTGLEQNSEGDWQLTSSDGQIITAEIVVNAGGYRAGEVMELVGEKLPIVSLSHQYLVTEAVPDLEGRTEKLPLLRDPDVSYYLRQERDGLILGPYEWQSTAEWLDGIPDQFAYQLWPDDLERLEYYIEKAVEQVPILGTAGVQRVINGPIPYSPDGLPYIGPAHGLERFYQCCCFSFGIAQAGGAGKTLSEWVVHGEPEWDMWSLDPRRYTGYATQEYVTAKALEIYQNEYAIPFPHKEWPAGRPGRKSPAYDLQAGQGAQFGARGGWERATWFPAANDEPGQWKKRDPQFPNEDVTHCFRREPWHHTVVEEAKHVREHAGLMDLPGFTKYRVTGEGATAFLDRIICSKLPKKGRLSLAYSLTEAGGILSEYTVTRIDENDFYLVSAAAAEWHDHDWLVKHMPKDGSVVIEDITEDRDTLVIAGPSSRRILAKLTDADLSNDAFKWLTCQTITVAGVEALALRVTYVGELGYELHIPMDKAAELYQAIMDAGEAEQIRPFGMYSMDLMRMEKCYRGWKVDLDSEHTPAMSSLDRFVDMNKPDFIGREALLAEEEAGGPSTRLVPLIYDEIGDYDAPFCAPVTHDGENVGIVTSSTYSPMLDAAIALAFVRTDLASEDTIVEVSVFGNKKRARVAREPLFDPNNNRLRC